ncbi:unnamed protein product [Timema podura]|uniref:Aspartate aminotransferase n=1 Tax=Timema podura TaxID=61482 RepID=A0ABN7P7L2_TIMPD|nr:unnamed protein product [Timema podura]
MIGKAFKLSAFSRGTFWPIFFEIRTTLPCFQCSSFSSSRKCGGNDSKNKPERKKKGGGSDSKKTHSKDVCGGGGKPNKDKSSEGKLKGEIYTKGTSINKECKKDYKLGISEDCGRLGSSKYGGRKLTSADICATVGQRSCPGSKPTKDDKVIKGKKGWWSDVEMGPPDAILGLTEAFNRSKDDRKVNVGVGAYRDDNGEPYVFSCIREAEKRLLAKALNKEYIPIVGTVEFCKLCVELALGEGSPPIKNGNYCAAQALSGTGALRIGAEVIQRLSNGNKEIFFPTPTWGNHARVFTHAGLKINKYRHYDEKTNSFDYDGSLQDIEKIPESSVVLFHACAHNPTGVDPPQKQWESLSKLVKQKNLLSFFDMAYQGFATGDFNNDAFAPRQFVKDGNQIMLAQSFAKNLGLYGERVGCFSIVTSSKEEAESLLSQIKIIIRGMYSSPPIHGQRLVAEVLKDPELRCIWECELGAISSRIIKIRKDLRQKLEALGSKKDWKHITDQIGMFCFTGLTEEQAVRLTKEFEIYLTKNGRISMAGVTSKNVDYIAKCMHEVTK